MATSDDVEVACDCYAFNKMMVSSSEASLVQKELLNQLFLVDTANFSLEGLHLHRIMGPLIFLIMKAISMKEK